ncbi:acetate/propionate family kinase [Brevundimonas bullata]|uniref:acetate/propionate family kinase n=1 Tax=Brevundimonas bullata TaxID=13160 RepID=UPI003D9A2F6D
MTPAILTLNAGSTSLKASLRLLDAPTQVLWSSQATAERDGWRLDIGGPGETVNGGLEEVASRILDQAAIDIPSVEIAVVAHRIVHGGADFSEPTILDDVKIGRLRDLTRYAPQHQGPALDIAQSLGIAQPDTPQIGCFDTAFHASISPLNYELPLYEGLRKLGYRRYGFHGLSYQSIAARLSAERPELQRVVVAHLGGGSSLCALDHGRSVATTMGMTALDGVPMKTRSGAIDPGVILDLVKDAGVEVVEDLLYHKSGLASLSGTDGDLRTIRATDTEAAAFAVDYWVLRIAEAAAALGVSLGGMQALVFTGGVGSNDIAIGDAVAARLHHLPSFELIRLRTDEELVLAQAAQTLIGRQAREPQK